MNVHDLRVRPSEEVMGTSLTLPEESIRCSSPVDAQKHFQVNSSLMIGRAVCCSLIPTFGKVLYDSRSFEVKQTWVQNITSPTVTLNN